MTKILRKKRIRFSLYFFLLTLILFFAVCINIPFAKLNDFFSNSYATMSELKTLKDSHYFGPIISIDICENYKMVNTTSNNNYNYEPKITFKLFNLIPIRTQKIKLIKEDKVILGGNAVGIVLKMDGVMIVGSSSVIDEEGKEVDALKSGDLKLGDIITEIEGNKINDVKSISKIINIEENRGKILNVKGFRNKKEFIAQVKPIYDNKSETYKLGIWVRDDASGIGTITYVNSNSRFGALGHPICDSDTKSIINLKEGELFDCSILDVKKGESGSPGELKGFFMHGKNEQGVIEKNNNFGIFGTLNNDSSFLKNYKEIEIGSRISAKPGKAKIRCCLDSNKIEEFDIEIIKTNFQNHSNSKSMVIRVVDKDLLERTGGIVQGMSGSPIIQDGKLIGAVTHVFLSDPTKGFGIYIDWMIEQ